MSTLIATVLLSFVFVLIVIAAMSIGVLFGRQAIRGSCGGVAGEGCDMCSKTRCGRQRATSGDVQ